VQFLDFDIFGWMNELQSVRRMMVLSLSHC